MLAAELSPMLATLNTVVANPNAPDLTMRQLVLLMSLANLSGNERWGVKEAAEKMNVSKPAITRASDRLTVLELLMRKKHPMDRRQVVLMPTPKGLAYLRTLARNFNRAGKTSKEAA